MVMVLVTEATEPLVHTNRRITHIPGTTDTTPVGQITVVAMAVGTAEVVAVTKADKSRSRVRVLMTSAVSPNKSLQGSVIHKVLGRGRFGSQLEQVVRARVLNGRRAAPELSR